MVKPRVPEGGAIKDDNQLTMEDYSDYMKKNLGKEYRKFIQEILEYYGSNLPKNSKVLEIGPGPGWIGIWLSENRPDLIIDALEPSEDMIRVASNNAIITGVKNQITYHKGYVENMKIFNDCTYDLVFSNESLHHWVDPIKGFNEISRIVKPEGNVFIKDGRRNLGIGGKFILYVLGRIFAGKMWKWWKSSMDASYTPDEIQQMIFQVSNCEWQVTIDVLDLTIHT